MITAEQAIVALRAVVKGREAYAYRDTHDECTYMEPDGTPSCLVGCALNAIAPALAYTARMADRVPGGITIEGLAGDLNLSAGATAVFAKAQKIQDAWGTWGAAVALAEDVYQGLDK